MAHEYLKHSGRTISRWIPDNAIVVNDELELGVVYVYRGATSRNAGKLFAVGYAGKAGKPAFHYSYRDMAAVDLATCNFFDSLREHKERVRKYRKEDFAGHTFKAGDVVSYSWGYDQTNVDWFRVTQASKCYVWLQAIAAHVEENGFMSGPSEPAIDTSSDDASKWGVKDTNEAPEKHRASGDSVRFDHGVGSKWDGEKKYCSWYA